MQALLKNIIYGLAIGDALGVPVEFYDRFALKRNPVIDMRGFGTYNQPKGSWSDDTSLTLCLLDGISFKNNSIDFKQVAENMINWLNLSDFTANNFRFDVGNTCRNAIVNMEKHLENPWVSGELNGKGNGSLMRISPLILFTKDMNENEKIKIIKDVCFMTHQNELCFLSCFFYISFAQNLINFKNKEIALDKTIEEFNTKFSESEEFDNFKRIIDKRIFFDSTIYSTGFVIDTLEASLNCFLTTNNFKESILKAVNLGEDTDTIAAITGSLSGLFYGFENIPDEWIDDLLNKDLINKTIDKSLK